MANVYFKDVGLCLVPKHPDVRSATDWLIQTMDIPEYLYISLSGGPLGNLATYCEISHLDNLFYSKRLRQY